MPRSVNSVASRARRKKVMKQAKGYFGRRKNVWTVAKNAVEKVETVEVENSQKHVIKSFTRWKTNKKALLVSPNKVPESKPARG